MVNENDGFQKVVPFKLYLYLVFILNFIGVCIRIRIPHIILFNKIRL